ncbi:MAG: type IV pilus modification protein PilV [Gammaproteobacteria bacterium]|nr:type IV pilus modification protein PilV [Gammaproteobacteria bacterium]
MRRESAGFTIIEIMVAIAISSIGMLGIAALQLNGLHGVNSSGNRTQVNLLIDDLIERMQANPTAAQAGQYIAALNGASVIAAINECQDYYNGVINTAGIICTPAQMAAYDMNTWFFGTRNGALPRANGIRTQLPASAVVAVTCADSSGADAATCTAGSVHTICVSWQESGVVGGSAVDCAGTAVVAPSTIQLVRYNVVL